MPSRAALRKLDDCLTDQYWRLNNLYRITSKEGREIDFRMNESQEDFYAEMWYYNVILKARQRGFSTIIQLLMLDMCVFHRNTHAGIIAQSREDAESIFDEKVKFAYDRMPYEVKATVTAKTDSARELSFSNGSKIRVGTSLRGGTLQALHISEYGKIAAKFPDKAKEIKTGALNTVQSGQYIFVESTAEGIGGEFHDLCKQAERLQQLKADLTPLDPKFHFYPWFGDPGYRLPNHGVSTPQELQIYFDRLKGQGIELDSDQRGWYIKKQAQQGDDMKKEFPSTAKEAFEVAVAGAYYAKEMARVRKEGRICRIPVETAVPVNTFWDLGRNDSNAIWMHQAIGKENRFIGFYQNSGESLAHYVKHLKEWLPDDCVWGEHYLPHDASVVELTRTDNKTREEVINDLGLRSTRIVPRIPDLNTGIELTRESFASAWFDERQTDGIACLDNYRKDWNEQMGVWRDTPRKSEWNHGADAFRQYAQGYDDDTGWSGTDDIPVVRVL